MRVLVAGWTNSPHVTAWAAMLVELGYDVALVGRRAPLWPPAEPPRGLMAYEELRVGRAPLLRSLDLGHQVRSVAEGFRPELVHAHWLPEYGWLAARARLHPLVSSAWGSDVLGAGVLARRRSSAAINGSDLVLADSAPLADAVRALAPDGAPVEVLHPGVDVQRFSPGSRQTARHALGWPGDVPVVLSARALSPLHNQPLIVRAVARLRESFPNVRLVLKHPGSAIPASITEALRESGLNENVEVMGHVDPDTMPVLYRAADVVLSLPSSDSSPATAWEALACARPLVVSDLPWARAELRHRHNAWLAPIDEEAVARSLAVLLGDAELAAELGSRGRALVEETMDRRVKMRWLDQRYRALVADTQA